MAYSYLVTGYLATLCLAVGFLLAMFGLVRKSREWSGTENALTASPVGWLVVLFAKLNMGDSLKERRGKIEQKLLQAGQPGGNISGAEFLAVAELSGLVFSLLLMAMIALLTGGLGVIGVLSSLFIGAFGTMIVFSYLDSMLADRKRLVSRQFPYFLDLAVMTMEAGSGFLDTVAIYVKDNPKDVLAEEFKIFLGETRMGKTLNEALVSFKERVAPEEIHNVVNALMQGQKLGTPLGEVLKSQADAIRFKRSQNAERYAEELKVRLQGPAMMMMVSVLILILGPAFLEATKGGVF